jgi:MYXO-CTERM domain-containing protein
MNQTPKKTKPANNMEQLKEDASACGAGCGCHGTEGTGGRTRWVVGLIILLGAGAMAGRALMKSDAPAPQGAAPGFAAQPAAAVTPAETPVVAVATPQKETADAAPVAAPKTEPAAVVGQELAAFAELNTLAANRAAVFVFLPAIGPTAGNAPTAPMEAAARTLEAQGKKVGLFTLKTDSPDYEGIAAQAPLPAVLALVAGRSAKVVSGEITETKLVQAFVAASSGGGCGAGGGSCGPTAAGCK